MHPLQKGENHASIPDEYYFLLYNLRRIFATLYIFKHSMREEYQMGFCTVSKEYLKEGYTQVDNAFFINYLPDADPIDVKVYLYGLFAANNMAEYDNNISSMAYALRLDEKRIMEAYSYWDQKGLVSIKNPEEPYEIMYQYVKVPLSKTVRYETRELQTFTTQIYSIWPNSVFTIDQMSNLFEFIKSKRLEPAAAILIMKYYEQENGTLKYSGIISMAQNFFTKGLLTEDAISRYLDQVDSKKDEAANILSSLGRVGSEADLEMRELQFKWTKEYSFPMESILFAAKECKKKGGKSRLIQLIEDLHQAKAITIEEVKEYISAENDKLDLAKKVVDHLGTFSKYENVVRFYIDPWMSKGFDMDAIETIAKFCYLRGVKELSNMDNLITRFHKEGLLTNESISSFVSKETAIDKCVMEVLSVANNHDIINFVTKSDRNSYKTFLDWGFDHDAIIFAAEFAKGMTFPMAFLSKHLSILKNRQAFNIEEIKSYLEGLSLPGAKHKNVNSDVIGGLSKLEANAIIRNIEDIDIDSEEM